MNPSLTEGRVDSRDADRRSPWWLAADVVAVTVFAVVGRRSHAEGLDIVGTLGTALPFLGGVASGWAASKAWRRPTQVKPTGLIVWVSALVGGMALRVVFGGSTQLSFVIVAGTFLALTLLGWRAVAQRL